MIQLEGNFTIGRAVPIETGRLSWKSCLHYKIWNDYASGSYSIFSFTSAHIFFKSCPDSRDGYNCPIIEFLESVFRSYITFDTRLAYRNGGNCDSKQDVFGLRLLKLGETNNVVYSCTDNSYCSNNARFTVSYQGRDKFDFQLILNNLRYSDNGLYKLEVNISYRGTQNYMSSNTINRIFGLTVISGTF